MQRIFDWILDNYKLVQPPVEPYASNPIAPSGVYWLKVTACVITHRKKRFETKITLALVNHDLAPPFEAIYELDERLSYRQLCAELKKVNVILHHPDGIEEACRNAVRTVGYANCLPDDAPAWMDQNAGIN